MEEKTTSTDLIDSLREQCDNAVKERDKLSAQLEEVKAQFRTVAARADVYRNALIALAKEIN